MTTYNWTIDSLYSAPFLNGQVNVVILVNWVVTGSDGTHTSVVHGSQPLEYVTGSTFTKYSNLTQNTIVGWLQTAMGEKVTEIQNQLDLQLANLANPSNSSLLVKNPLPWNN